MGFWSICHSGLPAAHFREESSRPICKEITAAAVTAGHMMYKYFQKSNITIKKSNKIIAMSFFS